MEPYVDALCSEVDLIAARAELELQTVYFGGGTPSMLSPLQVEAILQRVDQGAGIASGAEISLEANPDAVDIAKLRGFRAAGVNRLSFGVQSLQSRELRRLGRSHGVEDAAHSLGLARQAGFLNLSLDLIYGTPEQTRRSWRSTLQSAISLEPDHLSAYSLIVEPGTRFHRLDALGRLDLPEDDAVADMYHQACRLLADAGYIHYEVANWARPGYGSRHNLAYWHDEQFFAAGVGAYDYLRPYRSLRIRGAKKYIEAQTRGHDVISSRDQVTPMDERFETAIMRLRLLQEGLSRDLFLERFGETIESRYGDVLTELSALGFTEDDGRRIRLREDKIPLANEAWQRFLPEPLPSCP